jgi:hypothetical protein
MAGADAMAAPAFSASRRDKSLTMFCGFDI